MAVRLNRIALAQWRGDEGLFGLFRTFFAGVSRGEPGMAVPD